MPITVEGLERLVRDCRFRPTSFSDGGYNARRWVADFSASCEAPVTVELNARPSVVGQKYVNVPQDGRSMTVSMHVPCRKCENCLRRRAAHWRLRSVAEYRASYAMSGRTWLTTLTIAPEHRFRILNRLRSNVGYRVEREPGRKITVDFDGLTPQEILLKCTASFRKR